MIYIIAQNIEQARAYAKKRNIRQKDYKYIATPDHLLGLPRKTKAVKTGTWRQHKLIYDIMAVAVRREFDLVEEAI